MNGRKTPLALVFNPFVYVAGGKALALGLSVILLTGVIGAVSNSHFDGVLDTHSGAAAPLWLFFSEGYIDWLCLAVVLLITGRIISRTSFRTIDVLGTQALARWPFVFISLAVLPPAFQRFTHDMMNQVMRGGPLRFDPFDTAVFAAVIMVTLPVLCWTVVLMYKAFSVSCNVTGGKAIVAFIIGLLIAEGFSKVSIIGLATLARHPMPSASASPRPGNAGGADSSTEIEQAGRHFVDLLAAEDFASAVAQFDPTMRRVLPEAALRKIWEDLVRQAGPLQKQLATRLEEQQGFRIAFVTCQFERAVLDMKVVFDSQKRVAGLFYIPNNGGRGGDQSKGK